jgi:hypothetical protein
MDSNYDIFLNEIYDNKFDQNNNYDLFKCIKCDINNFNDIYNNLELCKKNNNLNEYHNNLINLRSCHGKIIIKHKLYIEKV